jgi:hypothetical protein
MRPTCWVVDPAGIVVLNVSSPHVLFRQKADKGLLLILAMTLDEFFDCSVNLAE